MRICSFLPSATEMVCALGLENDLVGISHECDYPPTVKRKPVVVRSVIPTTEMTPSEIDRQVSERMRSGASLYEIDERILGVLNPDLILTQDLCQVCAPSGGQADRARSLFDKAPQLAYLTPHTLSDIMENILQVGELTFTTDRARELVRDYAEKIETVKEKVRGLPQPRVFCMEWLDPVYNAGHWVPEMVSIAGGRDELAAAGKDSIRLDWAAVVSYQPEVLILTPCGYHTPEARRQAEQLKRLPGWDTLPAVKNKRIFAVDASAYFARPGPRVVEGIELLAHLIHPEAFKWEGPADAYAAVLPA